MSRRRWSQLLIVTVVTVCLLVLSGIASAQGNSDNAFDRVKEVQERHTAELMAKEGVVGTAIGFNDNDRQAVLVLLEKGGVAGIPQELEGVPVHPVVTGKIEALNARGKSAPAPSFDPTKYCTRPVFIGVSTGHPLITAGTIGCRVTKNGAFYALSNNHVYANENKGIINQDHALQPGSYDGGQDPADAVGTLYDFEPIVFSTSQDTKNTIDAAIALVIVDNGVPRDGNATPSNGYGKPSSAWVAASVHQAVQKYGRTTSLTKGKVYAISAIVNVSYGSGKTARFINQILITPGTFSAGGDSGSLIVTQSGNNPVGLLFAGSSSYTIANPIDAVLGYFHVAVDDSSN